MPQTIQQNPYGLLGLLNSKAGGQNPNALLDEVRPAVELFDLYSVQNRRSINSAIAAPVLGLNIFPTTLTEPPAGEIWVMKAITVLTTAVIAVATTFRFIAGVHDIRNGSFTGLGSLATAAAVGEHLISAGQPSYIWRPGDQAAVFVLNATNPAALRCTVTFDRIPV